MRTFRTASNLHPTQARPAVLSRRATFMLAIGGGASLASRSSPARAEIHAMKPQLQNLKAVGADRQVVAIRHYDGTFEVQTADGRNMAISAINLHFKIDASDRGPRPGSPVILPSGMTGDRATVFFASPTEIGNLVQQQS